MKPKGEPAVPVASTRPPKPVPVIVEVRDGVIKCAPDPVKLGKNNEVEWVYNPGGLLIEFETDRPFGRKQHRGTGPSLHSGAHDCQTHERFKYTITVPDPRVRPLDPVVDVDPGVPYIP
jgi:hypothetical protein